jgi:hypothetical protein
VDQIKKSLQNLIMNKAKLFSVLTALSLALTIIISCSPSIKTISSWVNKEKLPENPIKSVFIIAFTDNMQVRAHLESDLAAEAQKKGLKTYMSMNVIGPVDIKHIAPVREVFLKKLQDLNCETIFTIALVDQVSETRYVQGSTGYSPYSYGGYGGFGGYGMGGYGMGGYGAYGGFGGYYSYASSTMSTPGYYTTDKKYFLEAKMFSLKTDDLLLSIQTKADNPDHIEESSKQYIGTLMDEIEILTLKKK